MSERTWKFESSRPHQHHPPDELKKGRPSGRPFRLSEGDGGRPRRPPRDQLVAGAAGVAASLAGAIVSLAVGRMIIMPVIGVLIVHGLVHVDIISKDDKVLQFVCMYVIGSVFPFFAVHTEAFFALTNEASFLVFRQLQHK